MSYGKRNRSTNNPYLTAPARPEAVRLSFGSELKRLAGSPYRVVAALFLVVAPLLLALAGGLDLLTAWLYTVAHHAPADSRPTISLFDCLADQSKKLCSSLVWAGTASPKRIVLYPWHGWDFLHQFEPGLFLAMFTLAVLTFAAIGSPNAIRAGKAVVSVIGVNRWAKQAAANQKLGLGVSNPRVKTKKQNGKASKDSKEENQAEEVGIIPALQIDNEPDGPIKAWQSSFVLGGHLPRMWESDPGYFYLDREVQPVPYWLTLNMLRTNLVIVAPQGSGKTYSVYRPMLTFMRRSHSVAIFWDSKGDDFDSTYFDYNFDPEHPDLSIKINIFAGENPTQAGERLAEALIPDLGGDKQYFSNNAKDAMAALTAAHNIVYERNPKLTDLLNYLTSPAKVQSLSDMVLEGQRGPQQYEEALRTAAQLRRVLQLAENKNTDVLGSLATALNPLVTGSAAKVLVTNSDEAEEVYTIEKLLQKPGLIRLSLPVAKSPRLAPILGRLILSQFTYAVLSPDCNRKLFKMAAVDEARHFITDNVANGMAQARSNNAGYVLALQTLTQIKDESLLDTIFAVSGTKIVMAGVGEKDARRFSDTFGQLELPYVNHSQGQSRGTIQNNSSGYSRGQEYEFFGGQSGHEARSSRNTSQGRGQTNSQNTNSLTATRVRPRFFPAEIRELNQFLAVVESSDAQGRRWFAQVIDMRSATVNRLENRVLDQLRHLRDLQKQKQTSRSGPGHKGQNDKQPAQTSEPAPAPGQIAIAKLEAKSDQTEGKEGTENATSSEKHPVGSHLDTATPVRKRLLTVRFLPVETNVAPTKPESAAEREVGKGKVTENSEQSLTSNSAASLEKKSEPEIHDKERKELEYEATGFPPVCPSTGAVGEEPDQPSNTAAPEPQPTSKEEMQIHEQQIKQLRPSLPPDPEKEEQLFVQGSFLNSPEAIPVVAKETVTPGAGGDKTSPEPEPELLPEIAPRKPRKRRITRVVGEIIPAPVITPTPFKETGFTAESGAEAGKGAVGKEGPKDPAGLL